VFFYRSGGETNNIIIMCSFTLPVLLSARYLPNGTANTDLLLLTNAQHGGLGVVDHNVVFTVIPLFLRFGLDSSLL